MDAVTNHRDFRAQEEEICHYFHLFSPLFAMKYGAVCHELNFFIFSCKPALHFLLVAQMVKNLAAV